MKYAILAIVVWIGFVFVFTRSAAESAQSPKRPFVIHCVNSEKVMFETDRCRPNILGNGQWVYYVDGGIYDVGMCTCRAFR